MKRPHNKTSLLLLALLLILAVPAAALPTITNITPAVGYTDGKTITVTINGSNFGEEEGDVWLEMSGESDIDYYSISTWSNTSIVCRFKIYSTTEPGDWDLVVASPGGTAKKTDAFTILAPMTLKSISPSSAQMDDNDVDFTLVGTGLSEVTEVYLYNSDYDNIDAKYVDVVSSTTVEGTFDLSDTEEDTYEVCVVDSLDADECDLSFKITTDAVGSIDISSSPSGASIYVDGSPKGTTPDTVDDLAEGSYKVVLKKSGYSDWGKIVKVTEGDTTTVDADLDALTAAPTAAPTTAPTTVKTVAKSTLKVPTSWPSVTAPSTTASPLDPAVIVGIICLVFIAFRKY